MNDAPSKFTLRPLRYVEPGSDSPWHEVFGTQEDGTHRPQYYSQLELPKILETLRKDARTWLSPELSVVLSRLALRLQRPEESDAQAQALKVLFLRTQKDASASVSDGVYYVALFFIFLDSEGKVLARAALKLYTNSDASGNVVSSSTLLATKPLSAGTACQTLIDLFYPGYGLGFYGLDPYGE